MTGTTHADGDVTTRPTSAGTTRTEPAGTGPTDTGPTGAGLVAAAAKVAEVAAEQAEHADRDRRLGPEVVHAFVQAGFPRHFTPTRWGGTAGGFTELLHAVTIVGAACASAAWCASLAAGASRMGVYLPEAGQRELWADGPDTLVVGALLPAGRARRADGGWRVTGSWRYTSLVDHSDWALACALTEPDGEPWFFALPRSAYRVVDTWDSVGMRGTGSNTLVADDVPVPDRLAFPRAAMFTGRSVGSTARCHTAGLRTVSGLLFGAPALGAARGALAHWIAARGAPATGPARGGNAGPTPGGPATGSAPGGATTGPGSSASVTLARCAGDIDAAELLLARAAAVADGAPGTLFGGVARDLAGGVPGGIDAGPTRNASDCALAVDYLVTAVERLFRSSGTRGQLADSPLQRCWRDLHTIASHVALQFEPAATAYGEALLGSRS